MIFEGRTLLNLTRIARVISVEIISNFFHSKLGTRHCVDATACVGFTFNKTKEINEKIHRQTNIFIITQMEHKTSWGTFVQIHNRKDP